MLLNKTKKKVKKQGGTKTRTGLNTNKGIFKELPQDVRKNIVSKVIDPDFISGKLNRDIKIFNDSLEKEKNKLKDTMKNLRNIDRKIKNSKFKENSVQKNRLIDKKNSISDNVTESSLRILDLNNSITILNNRYNLAKQTFIFRREKFK
tara:strand:- start:2345 stop:2791 length:447 start_codon:yes stop_codon:yes gene_type:complete